MQTSNETLNSEVTEILPSPFPELVLVKVEDNSDRNIAIVTLLLILLFSFLLFNDRVFDQFSERKGRQIGVLVRKERDVRYRLREKLAWTKPEVSQPVLAGDAIYTGDMSEAEIHLQDGSILKVESQSLVVIDFKGDVPSLDLQSGSVSGQLAGTLELRGVDSDLCGKGAIFRLKGRSREDVEVEGVQGNLNTDCLKSKNTIVGKRFFHAQKNKARTVASVTPPPVEEPVVPVPVLRSPIALQILKLKSTAKGQWDYESEAFIEVEGLGEGQGLEVEISESQNFKNILAKESVMANKATLPKLSPGTFFVRARTQKGQTTSAWSSPTEFSVTPAEEEAQIGALTSPQFTNPKILWNLDAQNQVTLTWKPVLGADQYHLEVYRGTDPEKPIVSLSTRQTSYVLESAFSAELFFRVQTQAIDGEMGEWSEKGLVRVYAQAPQVFAVPEIEDVKRSPADQGDAKTVKLNWKRTPKVFAYQTEYATDPLLTKPQLQVVRRPASEQVLPQSGKYQFKVRSLALDGTPVSEWSDQQHISYVLKSPLTMPVLVEPWDNASLIYQSSAVTPLWLSWRPVENALAYRVQVSRTVDFTKLTLDQEAIDKVHLWVPGPLASGKYYWRVQAKRRTWVSYWSQPTEFHIFTGETWLKPYPLSADQRIPASSKNTLTK